MDALSKKLLIVSVGFPPSGGMGIHRVTKFVKYLYRLGWEIHVITVHPTKYGRKDHSLLKDIPREVKIVRTVRLYSAKKSSKFAIVKFLFDYHLKWYPMALANGIKVIKDNNIGLIFASYPWASNIIIAFLLSLLTRSKLVIDYRDYWIKKLVLSSKTIENLERKILQRAQYITFNNMHTSKLYKKKFARILKTKCHVIENGFDCEDKPPEASTKPSFFNVVYTGNPYRKEVQRPFLMVLKDLLFEEKINKDDFKVIFVGYENNVDKEYIFGNKIDPLFQFIGDVPHSQSVAIQMTANLLLLFANLGPSVANWCTPGKFFEYLGANVPILALGEERSAIADYLKWTQSGVLVNPLNISKLKSIIMAFYNDWKCRKISSSTIAPLMPRDNFCFSNLTRNLEKIFIKCFDE